MRIYEDTRPAIHVSYGPDALGLFRLKHGLRVSRFYKEGQPKMSREDTRQLIREKLDISLYDSWYNSDYFYDEEGRCAVEVQYESHGNVPSGFLVKSSQSQGMVTVSIACEPEKSSTAQEVIVALLDESPSGQVYALFSTEHGYEVKSVGDTYVPLEWGNYEDRVVKDLRKVLSDLQSNHPDGRLTILSGPPGTGKTHIIQALTGMVQDAVFILTPPNMTENLTGPALLKTLMNVQEKFSTPKKVVLVVEDADDTLVKRATDNMGAIHGLLNLADGIAGKLLNIRIVATTNARGMTDARKRDDIIDPALLRPGRLSALVDVDMLSVDKAHEVLARLLGEMGIETSTPFTKVQTLAEVYRTARTLGWFPADISTVAQDSVGQ